MKELASASIVIFVSVFGVIPDEVAANKPASDRMVAGCHIQTFGARQALREISQRADVAIGVDAIQPETEKPIVLDFPGGTVADLLNMFVAQSPDYMWREDNGIIHVFRNGAHVSLTDVLIAYPGAQDQTRFQMWMNIQERPEVLAWMKSNSCHPGELFHAKNFKPHQGPISIAPGRMTVAQLLDDIALQSGINYWAVLQSPPSTSSCHVSVIVW